MHTHEKIRTEIKRKEPTIYSLNEESYQMLSNGYWFTLFISGILFIWAFGLLGWRTGIGWFFLSNFIAVFLVRLDIALTGNIVLWYERRHNNISSLLNWYHFYHLCISLITSSSLVIKYPWVVLKPTCPNASEILLNLFVRIRKDLIR